MTTCQSPNVAHLVVETTTWLFSARGSILTTRTCGRAPYFVRFAAARTFGGVAWIADAALVGCATARPVETGTAGVILATALAVATRVGGCAAGGTLGPDDIEAARLTSVAARCNKLAALVGPHAARLPDVADLDLAVFLRPAALADACVDAHPWRAACRSLPWAVVRRAVVGARLLCLREAPEGASTGQTPCKHDEKTNTHLFLCDQRPLWCYIKTSLSSRSAAL